MRMERPQGYGRAFMTRERAIPFRQLGPGESVEIGRTGHFLWRIRPVNHWDTQIREEIYVWYGDPDENPEFFTTPQSLKEEVDLRAQQQNHLRDVQISADEINALELGKKMELFDTNGISTESYIAKIPLRPISDAAPADDLLPANLMAVPAPAAAAQRGGRRRRSTKRRRTLRRRKTSRRRN
jgi:hypothetical protein